MPKSDSARKPKMPRVWVEFNEITGPRYVSKKKFRPLEGDTAHQYAPLQPPRRCVWKVEGDKYRSTCNNLLFFEYVSGVRFCPYCGGRIVRRKS